jgi:iron complex transport system substrate-binding protein
MVGGHWVPEMVRLAGGVDLLGPQGQPSVPAAWADIVAADPDVIVLMPCGYDLATTVAKASELDQVEAWPALRAVREHRVIAVDGSGYFNRPGPRVIDGVELLMAVLHPDNRGATGLPAAAATVVPVRTYA